MQGKNKVVEIGGVFYSVDDVTPDGFVVMKPQMVWLKVHTLQQALTASAKTLKQTFGEVAYQDLRSFCDNCLSKGEKIAVKALAYKEIGNNRFTYKCLCLCGESEKLYTFMDTLVEVITFAPSTPIPKTLPLNMATKRMPTYASATR